MKESLQIIWLSHILNDKTPAFGGGESMRVESDKKINCGDSCNTSKLIFSNHLGSHVDAPRHFIDEGVTTESYKPEEWIFEKPLVIHTDILASEIVTIKNIEQACDQVADADLVLLKTNFERFRGTREYWEKAPGYAPELAMYLKNKFKSFSAIGMDSISISSYQHRDLGRETHHAFLGAGIRVFEDLSLSLLTNATSLSKVIALPLRFQDSDGAPCTIVGWVEN